MAGKAGSKRRDDLRRIIHRQRRLGDEGEVLGILGLERQSVLKGLDQGDRAFRKLPQGAVDFGMARVADKYHMAVGLIMAFGVQVHLGDQGAGCVQIEHVAKARFRRSRLGHAMGGKNDGTIVGAFAQLFDEDGAELPQPIDHMVVMNDLVLHIDGRAIFFDRPFDDLDGPIDSGAEAPRIGEGDGEAAAGRRHSVHEA